MPYRPKEIAERLGISPVTLRVWSNQFAPLLSDGARKAVTSSGNAGQRRYTDADIAILERASVLLGSGATYEEARRRLQEPSTAGQVEQIQTSAELQTYLTHLQTTYQQALGMKDETIVEQRGHIESLRSEIEQMRAQLAQRAEQPRRRRWFWQRDDSDS